MLAATIVEDPAGCAMGGGGGVLPRSNGGSTSRCGGST
jgi:hypothetical protein